MDMNIISRLLVFASSCFVVSNTVYLAITFGTFYLPLLDKFNKDRATTATVQSLLIGVTCSTGLIWGILCRKFGLWKVMFVGSILVPLGFITSFLAKSLNQLIFCIGIMSGIGTSIVYVCSSAAVARTFENKGAGTALAVFQCVIGIVASLYSFLLDYILLKYDLSGTFLLLGGLNLNNLAVTQLYYNKLGVKETSQNSQKTVTMENTASVVQNTLNNIRNVLARTLSFRFCIFIIAIGMSIGFLNGFLVVVLDVFAYKNFTNQEGLYSFTIYNGCSIFGRLLPVLFQLKKDVHPMIIFIICSVFGCVGQLVMLLASNVALMYVGCGLSGIASGGFVSGGSVALLHLVQKDMFDAAFGLMLSSYGITSCSTGPLYGWIRDELQSYNTVLALTAGVLGFSAFLFFIDLCVTKTVNNNRNAATDN